MWTDENREIDLLTEDMPFYEFIETLEIVMGEVVPQIK
jgi:hypothetical protein